MVVRNNLVVARCLGGRVVKGSTNDFAPLRPAFHITVHGTGEVAEIRQQELKALFFVRSTGDPARQDLSGFVVAPGETQQGRKIAVLFQGEIVCGYGGVAPDRGRAAAPVSAPARARPAPRGP